MKKLTLVLFALFAFGFAFSQEKTRVRVIMMKVKPDMISEFEKGVAAHMAKYHPLATDPVSVFRVMSGSRSNEYHYVQPGLDWAGIEGKSYPADHQDDWAKNAGKYLTSSEVHYLNHNSTYSYNESASMAEYEIVNFITLKQGQYGTFLDMMKTRKDALTSAKDGRNITIYNHSFSGVNNEFDFVQVRSLTGGLKDLDKQNTPLAKILNEQVGDHAQQEYQSKSNAAIEKVETFLVRKMANLSSK
jgi:hypothetical protein